MLNGLFVVKTVHIQSSLIFWDPNRQKLKIILQIFVNNSETYGGIVNFSVTLYPESQKIAKFEKVNSFL